MVDFYVVVEKFLLNTTTAFPSRFCDFLIALESIAFLGRVDCVKEGLMPGLGVEIRES